MEVIVPAAGMSSRFPGMKPKYLLYDYKHELMLTNAISYYYRKGLKITIGILREHDEKYNSAEFIRYHYGNSVNIIILDEKTKGPADTVYQILQRCDAKEFIVKDCDSSFIHELTNDDNYVCVSNISEHETLNKLYAKSFVICNEQGIITDIVEKKVVSNNFCVGGYKFRNADKYMDAYELVQKEKEVYVSDVISTLMNYGEIFTTRFVKEYQDFGTVQEWLKHNDRPVIFCDIDGTLIHNQTRVGLNNYNAVPIKLENNVRVLLEKQEQGAQFVFTTSRTKDQREVTEAMLKRLGFRDFELIMGLQNTRRILINDYDTANPYPRAEAINLKRNSDNLSDYL
jgi:hypothetical protein